MESWEKEILLHNIERASNIAKSIVDDIEKARVGFYKDTPQNRRLGKVGQSYGTRKQLEEESFHTTDRYVNEKGHWSRKRIKEVHIPILNKVFDGIAPSDKPTAILLMGGSASGKGSATKQMISDITAQFDQKFAHLDVDQFKESLPEYTKFDPAVSASNVHTESSHLGNRARKIAVQNKVNFINDGTFSNFDKSKKMIATLKKQGYNVRLINVTVDIDEAKSREQKRAESSGRKVPKEVLESSHISSVGVYDEIKHLVDDYHLIDNNFGIGKQRVIDSKESGVSDAKSFKRFQDKRNYKSDKNGK